MTRRRFMPPESGSTRSSGSLGQLDEIEQLGGPPARLGPRQVEVAAVDEQVLEDAQLVVERVGLRHDAEPGPDAGPVACRVQAEDGQRGRR